MELRQCATWSLAVFAVGFVVWSKRHAAAPGRYERAPEILADCDDFIGSPKAPFTLVEFADYQCPPCRATAGRIPSIVAQSGGRLRMAFRNLPLIGLHDRAFDSAVAAEAAREQKRFWPMHDALMKGDLAERALRSTAVRIGLNMDAYDAARLGRARDRVFEDLDLAARLGLRGTPSFLLCCPRGEAYVLSSGQLSALSDFIGKYPDRV